MTFKYNQLTVPSRKYPWQLWPWILKRQLLLFMNFGTCFIRTIRELCNKPWAQLVINNLRSDDIILTRGTHLGCSLSPILFALSLEPLSEAVHRNQKILGVYIDPSRHINSYFIDDMDLDVTDPINSLKHLLPLFKDFGNISGFAINHIKIELNRICLLGTLRTEIQHQYNFRLVTSTWRYLGVLIPLHLKDLYMVIYRLLLNKVKSAIHNWSSKWLNWLELIELVKSTIFPQFLFQ